MELSPEVLAARIDTGRRYFETLRKVLPLSWEDCHRDFLRSRDTLLGLALIHPWWFEEAGHDPRGPRSFFTHRHGTCQSQLLWGYGCDGSPIEVDHLFPYGLGGPTRPDNGIELCREHNRLKGHDVHLIPWETYKFGWLSQQAEAVAAARANYRADY